MSARQRAVSIGLAAALLPWAVAPAHAQSSTGELRDEDYEHRIAGDLGFFYRTQGTAEIGDLQPSFYGNFALAHFDDVALALDVAWRANGIFGSSSAFRAMNPYVGVRAGTTVRGDADVWRLRGGLGMTLPLTNAYDDVPWVVGTGDVAGFFTQFLSAPMQGVYDAWLTSSLNAALVIRGDIEYRAELFVLGADAALAFLFPVEYHGRTGDTVVDMQLGFFAGGRPIPELTLGLRFQAVALVSSADTMGTRSNTEGYTSLVPFVRGELGPGFVEGRLLMNLDDPWGFAFDSGTSGGLVHVWAIQLAGGATF